MARVRLIEPSTEWPILRVAIEPQNPSAASILVWEEFESLQVAAGAGAQWEFGGPTCEDDAASFIRQIIECGFTEWRILGVNVHAAIGRKGAIGGRYWRPYLQQR